jgi:S-DNA-T family DNA segregation ATPase FtsK/SpoIIIE
MIFQKPQRKNSSIHTSSELSSSNSVLGEVSRLFWICLSVTLLIALVSYSPSDPSWSTWSSKTHFQNWMGRVGSITSDLLWQALGFGAFLIPTLIVIFSMTKGHNAEHEKLFSRREIVMGISFLLSSCLLIQFFVPQSWMPWQLQHPGGIIGRLLASLLTFISGKKGASLLSIFFWIGIFEQAQFHFQG